MYYRCNTIIFSFIFFQSTKWKENIDIKYFSYIHDIEYGTPLQMFVIHTLMTFYPGKTGAELRKLLKSDC